MLEMATQLIGCVVPIKIKIPVRPEQQQMEIMLKSGKAFIPIQPIFLILIDYCKNKGFELTIDIRLT